MKIRQIAGTIKVLDDLIIKYGPEATVGEVLAAELAPLDDKPQEAEDVFNAIRELRRSDK